jgi:hypothetical protein
MFRVSATEKSAPFFEVLTHQEKGCAVSRNGTAAAAEYPQKSSAGRFWAVSVVRRAVWSRALPERGGLRLVNLDAAARRYL